MDAITQSAGNALRQRAQAMRHAIIIDIQYDGAGKFLGERVHHSLTCTRCELEHLADELEREAAAQ